MVTPNAASMTTTPPIIVEAIGISDRINHAQMGANGASNKLRRPVKDGDNSFDPSCSVIDATKKNRANKARIKIS